MYLLETHVIDFDKVNTIEDIKVILKELNIRVDLPSPDFEKLCKVVNKSDQLTYIPD